MSGIKDGGFENAVILISACIHDSYKIPTATLVADLGIQRHDLTRSRKLSKLLIIIIMIIIIIVRNASS